MRSQRVTSGVRAPMARPVASTCSTARRLMTGSDPGSPRHTGHVSVLGAAPRTSVEQPQNIFEEVLSWTWISTPMTTSYLVVAGADATTSACVISEVSQKRRRALPCRAASGPGQLCSGAVLEQAINCAVAAGPAVLGRALIPDRVAISATAATAAATLDTGRSAHTRSAQRGEEGPDPIQTPPRDPHTRLPASPARGPLPMGRTPNRARPRRDARTAVAR